MTCGALAFDTSNGEGRLSLRAVGPDPFLAFADGLRVGRIPPGPVVEIDVVGRRLSLALR